MLPNRVRGEQLEDWRELFWHTFKPLVDTAAFPEDPVYVATVINNYLIDTTRQSVSFAGLEEAPVRGVAPKFKFGKVYREYYNL